MRKTSYSTNKNKFAVLANVSLESPIGLLEDVEVTS